MLKSSYPFSIMEKISKEKIEKLVRKYEAVKKAGKVKSYTEEETKKDFISKSIVYAIYYLAIILFLISVVLFVTIFLKNTWITLTAIIFSVILGLYLLDSRDYLINLLLPRDIKKRIDFFIPRWKDREFDEFVGEEIIDLYEDSNFLFSKLKDLTSVSDYSFALVPLIKAYEGILKKILVRINLVKEEELKANPQLAVNRFFNLENNKAIINKLKDNVRDRTIPMVIFTTYQDCRNKFLHYDPYSGNKLTKEDAEISRSRIIDSIKKAYDTFIVK